jgi:eukaryotic-like serine/threonine-protein kinase
MSNNQNRCRSCGQERPADAPVGLCPVCLLRAGQNSELVTDDRESIETPVLLDPEAASCLSALEGFSDGPPGVLPTGIDPAERSLPRSPRLELFGPIGRGGMGVVLMGRDGDLGRDLAVKVLLNKYRNDPDMIRRFIEEAQIGGQLQHPGVVPVYELGTLPDRRPYFAMKLIRGRTLAELLAGRASVQDNQPRLLGIFEAVCQTMAYAHSRAVIHRDLKPSNIMVGSFGEVQVMDWGVAKVLGQNGTHCDTADETFFSDENSVSTGRGHSDIELSRPGSVIGTPAYMAPEQARGELETIDERADVFALGAILCEILTGRPGFIGATSGEIERRAASGDISDAHARLAGCGADAELVDLARDSLAVEPVDRPRDARIVATRLIVYRAGVEEKLHAAELAAVEARARADEEAKRRVLADQLAQQALARASLERRRRRLSLALAASILTFVVVCGGAATWFVQERQTRLAKVDLALRESEVLRDQALRDQDGDIGKWQSARAALERTRALMEAVPIATTLSRIDELASRIDQGAAAAEVDRNLVARLEEIRAGLDGDSKADAAYKGAFHAAGHDLVGPTVDPVMIGKRLAARPKGVAQAAARALDAWALVRRSLTLPGDAVGWAIFQNLLAVARAADPDPWRDALHDSLSRNDPAPLIRMAEEPNLDRHGPTRLWFLGYGLEVMGEHDRALDVLKRAQRAHPGDYWLNTELGLVLMEVKRSGPGATSSLITPGTGTSAAKFHEAELFLMAAVAVRPRFASAHHLIGTACQFQGKWDQAIAHYREGLRLQPDDATIYNSLANVYLNQAKPTEAVAAYQEAIRLNPAYDLAHANLILILGNQGKLDEAIAAARVAIKLAPNFHAAHTLLGNCLGARGRLDEAIAEHQEARRLMPTSAQVFDHMGTAYLQQGKLDLAVAAYHEAIRLAHDFILGHQHLAYALLRQGKVDLAIDEYREAIRVAPQYVWGHGNLAIALRQRGDFDQAAIEFRKALDLGPDPSTSETIRGELAKTERWQVMATRLPALLRDDDQARLPDETLDLAYFLHERRLYTRAAKMFKEALEQDGKLGGDAKAQNRYNAACSAAMAAANQSNEESPLADADRALLRRHAGDFLTADLAIWAEAIRGGSQPNVDQVRQTLRHWRVDPDLASVREPGSLATLPEAERLTWLAIWAKVDALLEQSGH